MRIKLDENLPASLADELNNLEHDVDTVPAENLAGKSDPEIWSAAQDGARFLITQDMDFSDMRRFVPGTHNGLVVRQNLAAGKVNVDRLLQDDALLTNEGSGGLLSC
jgi:predicted nuclease of predicted toxin-antitoxin system